MEITIYSEKEDEGETNSVHWRQDEDLASGGENISRLYSESLKQLPTVSRRRAI